MNQTIKRDYELLGQTRRWVNSTLGKLGTLGQTGTNPFSLRIHIHAEGILLGRIKNF